MTPAVLQLIEDLRLEGPLVGSRFLIARDAAYCSGAWLKVTSNRSVNVKKSNRPAPSLFGLDRPAYEVWSGAHVGGPFTLRAIEDALVSVANARPRQMTIQQDRPQSFQFAPVEQRSRVELRQVYPPHNADQATYHMPLGSLGPEQGFGFFGREWDSERIFRELKHDAKYVSDGYQIGRNLGVPIVLRAPPTVRQSAAMFVRRNSKKAPDPRAKPSRVPERLQKRRLDGRR